MTDYILTNRELSPVGKYFSFSGSTIRYKKEGLLDFHCVKHDKAPISKKWFLGKDCYITIYENEVDEQRAFLLINDDRWIYTYNLPDGFDWYRRWEIFNGGKFKNLLQTADAMYKKKKGIEADTPEDDIVKQIIEKLKEEKGSNSFQFLDTRKKIKDPCQIIKASDPRDKKRWEQFFEDIQLYGKSVPKKGLRYFPDLIIQTGQINRKGNEKRWLFEVELGKHNRKNFLYKLRKAHITGSPLYFLFSETYYQYHYDLIEYFLMKKYVKTFNKLYVTIIPSFLKDGMKSFVRIL